ncbi:PRC-barrel domain-containing protein [Aquibium microcysteis]|uniref:PRC-barrel domain-containing protein n=1 Tax=Aquibium microcysteis TaxID=675281 RepID=UPI00165CF1AE|nr:PRC-barrel domain-containing protein [Aquibium microcysteis]
MIRKLLATTALAALMSTGAYAQTTAPTTTQPGATVQDPAMQNTAAGENRMVTQADGNLASNIIGETVYNSTADDAESIGEVNDIVIGADGSIEALVIGVGGFLGIGEKDVAIEYDLAEWVERDNDRWIVVPTTTDALKAQPEFDRLAYQPMPEGTQVGQTEPATAEDLAAAPVEGDGQAAAPATDRQATTAAPAAEGQANQNMAAEQDSDVDVVVVEPNGTEQPAAGEQTAAGQQTAPAAGTDETRTAAIDRSTLQPMAAEDLTAENIIGSTVYGNNEENVGEVGDLVMSQDGQIDAVIIDVGGFLGIGEKEVAVGMDNLEFMLDENGNRYLYTPFTQEQLEAQPAYDETNYANSRDEMRMVVPN